MPVISANGVTLHYLEAGTGEPLLLLHGLGSCAHDWEFQIPVLANYFRVIALDLHGHGLSQSSPAPYDIADLAIDVAKLCEILNLQRPHLVGFSLGGMIAFDIAAHQRIDLASLTVINAVPDMRASHWRVRVTYWLRVLALRWLGLGQLGRLIGNKLFPEVDQVELRERLIRNMSGMRTSDYRHALDAITRWSVSAQLINIDCATQMIAADQDYTPVSTKQFYCEQIPGAHLTVIEDSRHATPLDQPEKLNKALLNFLTSVKLIRANKKISDSPVNSFNATENAAS